MLLGILNVYEIRDTKVGRCIRMQGTFFSGVAMNRFLRNTVLASIPVMMACMASAQDSRASLGGKVTDASKAVIPGATVIVTSVETGVINTVTTNKQGEWLVQYLLPGHYTFDVDAPGFETSPHDAVELQVADKKTYDVRLAVGGSAETVNVTSQDPLLDTSGAVTGTVITQKELEDLPTQSHVPTLLVGLTPGAVVGNGVGGAPHLWSNGGDSQIQVNGSGSVNGSGAQNNQYSIQYTLDGAYDSNVSGQVAFVPPEDAISEFRVQSNAYDASIGRQSGATLNMVTKTGTKDYHGSAYEYHQDPFLNARVYTQSNAVTKPVGVHYNEFGGTFGGPVFIPKLYSGRTHKTFFFLSYDGIHNNAAVNTGYMTLPSAAERNGDFSQTCQVTNGQVYGTGGGCQGSNGKAPLPFTIYDPNTVDANGNRTAFANNMIPTARISPFAKAIYALMPLPDTTPTLTTSSDANNYTKKETQRDLFSSYIVRLDQTENRANHTYANISFNGFNETSYDPFGGFAGDVLNDIVQARKQKTFTLDHTVLLNQRMVLDLKYNILNSYGNSYSGGINYDPSALGISSAYLMQMVKQGIPTITGVANGAENGGLGTTQAGAYNVDTFQTIDAALTQQYRQHSIKYGFQHMIQQQGAGGLGAAAGSFSFGSATNTSSDYFTCQNPISNCAASIGNGSNVAQFDLGLPLSGSIPINATAFWSQHYTAAYFQDDWRATTNLTLNVGLRWDYQTGVSERHQKAFTRYDPTYVQSAVTTPSMTNYATLVGGTSTNIGVQLLQRYRGNSSSFVSRGAIDFAGVGGTAGTVTNPRYLYFQPRIGFAYRVYPKTVLRGGLGRFVQADFITASQTGFSSSTAYVATGDNYKHPYTNPTTGSMPTLNNPYPDGLTQPTGNALGAQTNIGTVTGYTDPNLGRVYVDEASVSVQQELHRFLIEIGGTVSSTHDLALATPTNAIPTASYLAAFGPQFDANGRPLDTLAGSTPVTNPYKGVAGLLPTSGIYTSSTLNASQLLRPNPVIDNDIPVTTSGGKATYYGLLTKVERRYQNGFSLLQSFSWTRNFTQDFYLGNTSIQLYLPRQIYSNDVRFHYTTTPIYELPFGKGKYFLNNANRLTELAVGGWELTGIYNAQSGLPIVLPTNSAFYRGDKSPNINVTRGRTGTYFDTTAFVAYPNKSTPAATIHDPNVYPAWTGISSLPGYNYVPTSATDTARNGVYNDFNTRNTLYPQTFGDIRYPGVNTFTAGIRKNLNFTETLRVQLRMDATNLFNHPQFGGVGTDPTNAAGFGKLGGGGLLTSGINERRIEIAGKVYF